MRRTILFNLRGDISRSTIAKELDITPQMLGAIERGDRTPSLFLAKKIADYYGKSVDEIFFNQNRHDLCLDKPNTA
ncbi:helix-turn-helix transcriptional regulator [Bacillus licheniformis]|uniref:helix-turn-helix transcriptional regulator n=1 Tax=Bacillus licheniformis TaxID=1402 RepID=UPI000929BC05|nr:helix-turn-helix domain-containing protein [Bacillus licheniformis]OJT68797.1 transcriptional regulator [Bacillus licheniformis]